MDIKILRKLLFGIALLLAAPLTAQQVTNIEAKQLDNQKVRVSYDLQGELPGQLFKVELYSSANNFRLPLLYVEGHVGEDVKAGIGKFIDWDFSKELVAFEGDLTFEVRALLTFSPLKVSFPVNGSARRGTAMTITWLGSVPNGFVDIELFRDDKKVSTIARTQNDGSYQWNIPIDTNPGQGYTIKVSSTSSTQFHSGGYFSIKRKIPLLVKFIPVAVAAPLVILLTDEGGAGGSRILPAPPDSPD